MGRRMTARRGGRPGRLSAPNVESELGLRGLVPALSVGLLIGIVDVVIASSLAALIFSGKLAPYLPAGIGITLMATATIMVVTALLSSLPGSVGAVQDTPAAILALAAAAIAARLRSAGPQTFLTVVLTMGISSAVAGGFFLALGSFRLGNLVRFVPYPVVGGFLAGTGWLLVKGGIGAATGTTLSLSTLSRFTTGEAVGKWVPALAFAVALLMLGRRYRHFLVIPGALLAGVALFYLALLVSWTGVGTARAHGWLLGPFPKAGLLKFWMASALSGARWSAVAAQAGSIATLVVVSVLALLLNASGTELTVNSDVDLNRELQAAGAANLAAALVGGIVGYQSLSFAVLSHKSGARTRIVGVISAGVCGATLLLGTSALSLFPRPILGGVILFLGLGFLAEWVLDARLKLPRSEYLIVLLILVVVATIGYLQGVAVGLVLAVLLFAISYSRTDLVKHTLSGASFQSNVERAAEHRQILRALGGAVHILELQGFAFFGTANNLLQRIMDRVADRDAPKLRFLVLDFRRVTGLDSSAVLSFTKARRVAESQGFAVVMTSLAPQIRSQLEQAGLTEDSGLRIFPDLDHGVQWCEDRLLESSGAPAAAADAPPWSHFRIVQGASGRSQSTGLMGYLERIDVETGRRVFRQGDPSEGMYFLVSGSLTTEFTEEGGKTIRLRTMGPGTVVGEVTMYLGGARTASVVADSPSILYRLSRKALADMEARDPQVAAALHRMLAALLAERLADSVHTIGALLD